MSDDLYELLEELRHYMDNRADVVDGEHGQPEANYEMSLVARIDEYLDAAPTALTGTR